MAKGHFPFYFVSDLHGREKCYQKLFSAVREDIPKAVFCGGDLLPSGSLLFTAENSSGENFIDDFLAPELLKLKNTLQRDFPRFFIILGNDDARREESVILRYEQRNIWNYMHQRKFAFMDFQVYGLRAADAFHA